MKLPTIKGIQTLGKGLFIAAKENRSAVKTGLAVAGVVALAFAATKAAVEAKDILDEMKEHIEDIPEEDVELRKAAYKEYGLRVARKVAVPAIIGGATIYCILSAHGTDSKKIATLTAALMMDEEKMENLLNKTKEVVGEEKAEEIRDEVLKEGLKKNYVANDEGEIIIVEGQGPDQCYDEFSGTYFWSSKNKIEAVRNDINEYLNDYQSYVDVNEFYRRLGIRPRQCGELAGWSKYSYSSKVDLSISTFEAPNGRPTLCVRFLVPPTTDFKENYGR